LTLARERWKLERVAQTSYKSRSQKPEARSQKKIKVVSADYYEF
jgi:hypothetical protein